MTKIVNIQPIEKPSRRTDGILEVHSIFDTIQGEGPFSGHRAVFVRLAGCNLQCPGCDTDYTSTRRMMTPKAVIDEIVHVSGVPIWQSLVIVITGGEPFRQDLSDFLFSILDYTSHWKIQIESNGVLPLSSSHSIALGDTRVTLVVSPKTSNVHRTVQRHISAYKYVVQAHNVGGDGLPLQALENKCSSSGVARPHQGFSGKIYVQPFDEKDEKLNQANLRAVTESAMKHGYIAQVQLHKYLGVE